MEIFVVISAVVFVIGLITIIFSSNELVKAQNRPEYLDFFDGRTTRSRESFIKEPVKQMSFTCLVAVFGYSAIFLGLLAFSGLLLNYLFNNYVFSFLFGGIMTIIFSCTFIKYIRRKTKI